ncbi:MAG: tetratricopeptide repeat protein [Ignavibacteria bacterium]|nr:tetratricopeptide repeat protein [Ignavibacteria bacterium]
MCIRDSSYNILGVIYDRLGQYASSFDYLTKAIELFESAGDIKGLASCYNNLAIISANFKDKNSSLDYINKAIEIYKNLNDEYGLAKSLNNKAQIFNLTNDTENAFKLIIECIKTYEKLNDDYGLSLAYINLANHYETKGDLKNALEYFNKSLKLKTTLNEDYGIFDLNIALGRVHSKLGLPNDAIEYLRISESMVEKNNFDADNFRLYSNLAEVHRQLEDYKKAFEYERLSSELERKIYNEQLLNKTKSLQVLFDIERAKKESEIATLKNLELTKKHLEVTEKYQESEERNRFILQNALDAVIVINEVGKVVEWNSMAETIFGYTYDEAINKSLSELIIPEAFKESHTIGLNKFVKTGESHILNKRIEISAVNKKGLEFPVELAISPVKIEGKLNFSAFIRDISERKKADELMLRYNRNLEIEVKERTQELLNTNKELNLTMDKLIELDKDKNEFLSIVAHDLKSPISGILMSANSLKNAHKNMPEDKIVDKLSKIENTAKRIIGIVTNLLDINNIESGNLILSNRRLNISSVAEKVISDITPIANKKNISIETDFEDDYNEYHILGDGDSVYQVLENLISNAIKYSYPDSKVLISLYKNDGKINIEIKDEGQGIKSEELPKLFGKFSKLSSRPTAGESSNGLGLWIVKRLTELMNGKISCESEAGKGSVFKLEFNES